MSIIDRILGRTPTEGPQIHAPGKAAPAGRPAPITELPRRARGGTGPGRQRSASEGMIRVYDQFGRAVTIGREAWRQDVLLPNLQSNRNNPGRALRPGRERAQRRLCHGRARLGAAPGRDGSAAAARRHGARDRAAAAQGSLPAPAKCWNAPSPGMARTPIYWRTWRAPSRRPATTNARRRSSGARSSSSPTRRPRSTG